MREIKFRAWDGERLRAVWGLGWIDGEMDYINTPKFSGPAEDCKLMQYTGLKDKNGVEIYEGDIVDCFKESVSEVKFIDSSFGLYTNGMGFEPFFNVFGYSEVIGNIYENPELLEVSK